MMNMFCGLMLCYAKKTFLLSILVLYLHMNKSVTVFALKVLLFLNYLIFNSLH